MSGIKLSLVIPYKQRLDNIRLLFEGGRLLVMS